jgi:ribosomal protein L2
MKGKLKNQRPWKRALTEKLVAQMRRDYGRPTMTAKGYLTRRAVTLQEIADMYGVNKGTVSAIVRGETWEHVQ